MQLYIPLLAALISLVTADSPLGCFLLVNIASSQGTWMYQTSSYCAQQCSQYAYVAVKNGNECFCLSLLPSLNLVDSSECSTPCAGFGQDTCGGSDSYNVYKGTGSQGGGSASAGTASKTTSLSLSTLLPSLSTTSASSDALTSSQSQQTKVVTLEASASGGSQTVRTVTSLPTSSGSSLPSSLLSPSNKKSSTSIGPIVGGVVGGVAAVAMIAGLVFFLIRRRALGDDDDDEEEFYDKSSGGLSRGPGTNKSRKLASPLDLPMTNPFVHPADSLADQPMRSNTLHHPPVHPLGDLGDPRLNPVMMGRRRLSEGSLADETDYLRKILQVANPDA